MGRGKAGISFDIRFFCVVGIDFHSGEFFDAPLWNLKSVVIRFSWNIFLSAFA
ncbi:MAG TPA: hypothetical protein H9977_04060 [Candidatus Parabacteroides intestinipullorum]|uniref:Uncharacterized protein n=1 Tax=Candidatus Parabacteroides intestinipullorum TaxID=2838723 RepID=A0A9D2BFJ7_9BACT|nr:hypothetical protein [Candidatus Parabacteroides intestinipullorum]